MDRQKADGGRDVSSPGILIASNEEAIREILGDMLRADGCEVLAVASTDDAISQATQFAPDTLIIEVMMPGKINGLLAAKRIAQETNCKVMFLEPVHPGCDEYFDRLRQEVPDCDILPTPFEKDELLGIVHGCVSGWSIAEKRAAPLVHEQRMKLRYAEIDPKIIAKLPKWSAAELEREREKVLKELGITRQESESHLLAWVQTMLAENGREDNPENRQRLTETILPDWNAQVFVWVLGGDESVARYHTAWYLAHCWDYQAHVGQTSRSPVSRSGIRQTVFGLLVVAIGAWAASGLLEPHDWDLADVPILLVWLALIAAGFGLLLGLGILLFDREDPVELRHLAVWVAVPTTLIALGLHLHASQKLEAEAAQRELRVVAPRVDAESLEEIGYIQQIKRVDRLWEHRRTIYWFVRIPATNEVYSCSWESGFAGFAEGDAVRLIHKKDPTADEEELGQKFEEFMHMQPDDEKFERFIREIDWPYSGFVVGLHGDKTGRSASVDMKEPILP